MTESGELEKYIPRTDFIIEDKNKLDEGADSSVYKCGDYVVKVYKEHRVDLEGIFLYKNITNKFAEIINDSDSTYQVFVGNQEYTYRLTVNPILFAGNNPLNPAQLITVSRFIPGPRLLDYYPESTPFHPREFADPVSIQLEDLSKDLNTKFKIKGILILEPNVKFHYDPEAQPTILLTITDLCSHLWAFGLVDPLA